MLLHVAVYTSTLILATIFYGNALSILSILTVFVTHFIIDEMKAKQAIIGLWQDQLMYLLVIVFVVAITQNHP
ncbi:DUF3307 domain-containing protein [Patescibacteria group bacterium]|nr:DUF3307 domain-containing protein [Patescibacteria group bacterium]